LVGSPLFPHVVVHRANGKTLSIRARGARADAPYVTGLHLDGSPWTKPWLPETFVIDGGELVFDLSATPDLAWVDSPEGVPPSASDLPRLEEGG
jgi:putative alpha-1,2-mannosidase